MPAYDTILVGVDFSPLGDCALEAASCFAERAGASRLHLVHVVPNPPSWSFLAAPLSTRPFELAWDRAFQLREQRLREVCGARRRIEVTHETRTGSVARELVSAVEAQRADVVVLGTHGRGAVTRAVLGSVAGAVLRASPAPLWIVGDDRPGRSPLLRVLAAIDTSPVGEQVLRHAMALAAPERGIVHVFSVHEVRTVIDAMDETWPKQLNISEVLEVLDRRHREQIGTVVERARMRSPGAGAVELDVVSGGTPSRAILDLAASTKADAIVLGTSGHSAWKRMFLGSTATRVVNEAPCPVFVVPAGS